MKKHIILIPVILLFFMVFTPELKSQVSIQVIQPTADTTINPGDSVHLIAESLCSGGGCNISWSHGVVDEDGGWVSPQSTTEYTVFIIDTIGNSDQDNIVVYVDTTMTGTPASGLKGFALQQNYPNPAVEQTTIEFNVPYSGNATLKVVDITGSMLYKENLHADPGTHSINIDVSDFSSGVYFYSLNFEGYRLTKKLMVR
ncbi:MAG: T9SS type A sorting domain-containing protein [Bacteroidales bacterium]